MTAPRRLRPLVCGIAAAAALAAVAHAQQAPGRIVGTLVDRVSRSGIEGARVAVLGTALVALSDTGGRFVLEAVPPGVRVVQVRVLGYAMGSWVVELGEAQVLHHTFEMEPRPVLVAGVDVTGANADWRSEAGFEQRRARGNGVFLTREEIARRGAADIAQLMRTVPGIMTTCTRSGCTVRMQRSSRLCFPEYFLDGFPATFATGPSYPTHMVRGVEVYRSEFETPAEFQRPNLRCGVIAIWTHSPGEPFPRD